MSHDTLRIRPSTTADLLRIMEIYAHARDFMARHGNPRQWGPRCWPPGALIREDIERGSSYVCVDGDDRIVGTFFFAQGEGVEPTYATIEDGCWMAEGPYGVVHRIASDGSRPGVGTYCLMWALAQCGHLRIDTHGDNLVMRGLLAKLGFEYRGTIHVEEDAMPRMAFERVGM